MTRYINRLTEPSGVKVVKLRHDRVEVTLRDGVVRTYRPEPGTGEVSEKLRYQREKAIFDAKEYGIPTPRPTASPASRVSAIPF